MAEKIINTPLILKVWRNIYVKYVAGIILRIFLITVSFFLFIRILLNIFLKEYNQLALILSTLIVFVILFLFFLKKINLNSFIDFLNHKYYFLEFSSQLIPDQQNDLLLQLQRERISQIIVEREKEIKVSGNIIPASIMVFFFVILTVAFEIFPLKSLQSSDYRKQEITELPSLPSGLNGKLPGINSLKVNIIPPSYTGLSSQTPSELSFDAPEGSKIFWECNLEKHIKIYQIIWNGKDTVNISSDGMKYNWQYKLQNSLFYQIRYGENGKWFTSPIYTIRSIEDKPPVLIVNKPLPYTFIMYGKKPEVELALNLLDDYGLDNAHLIATVSRGNGESVKFREIELKFDESVLGKKAALLKKNLDFNQLKMEPGDELYFYAEATDRSYKHNKSRTDMYFIQWEDTTSGKISVTAGISLDNMPAYFRSQRQIIIDTEKLLAERKKLSEEEFQKRSNDLGVDQKILRLRYGQFLGEEFEGDIGGHKHNEEEEGHDHEKEDHNSKQEHDDEKALEKLHEHKENKSEIFGQRGDISEYQHIHDVNDEATFFDEALKIQLKAALAQMWESELKLRTMHTKEALPYEYKALELIKSLQQKSRVYVEKVGFKPTPLKPFEKRLTGELDEIINPDNKWNEKIVENVYQDFNKAIIVLEKAGYENYKLTALDKQILEKAGNRLTEILLKQPGINVSTLNNLREIINGNKSISVKNVQYQLIKLLPSENKEPGKTGKGYEPEMETFINKITK